jgi:hypothetical protein
MVAAKRGDEWSRTATMLAMHANLNRDAKRQPRPYTADQFNPMVEKEPAGFDFHGLKDIAERANPSQFPAEQ